MNSVAFMVVFVIMEFVNSVALITLVTLARIAPLYFPVSRFAKTC